ncbi:hypothetical protein R3P38DRAFT_3230334 [Favolaschia claudopus]|uniref:Uncharacterized protein n=1 Tax=Favolaschia claudopus TaxID=2862362 RepID=A0AAV9ZN10_9AGAR
MASSPLPASSSLLGVSYRFTRASPSDSVIQHVPPHPCHPRHDRIHCRHFPPRPRFPPLHAVAVPLLRLLRRPRIALALVHPSRAIVEMLRTEGPYRGARGFSHVPPQPLEPVEEVFPVQSGTPSLEAASSAVTDQYALADFAISGVAGYARKAYATQEHALAPFNLALTGAASKSLKIATAYFALAVVYLSFLPRVMSSP